MKQYNDKNSIFNTLRWRICIGIYSADMRLSENQFSKEFNLSRTPIRSILQKLEAMDFVKSQVGSGTYVTPVEYYQVDELFNMRIELIDLMSRLNPLPPRRDSIVYLEGLLDDCQNLDLSIESLCQAHTNLYVYGLNFIGNRPLIKVAKTLYYHTVRYYHKYCPREALADEHQHLLNEIRQLMITIKSGDCSAFFSARKLFLLLYYLRLKNQWIPGYQATNP